MQMGLLITRYRYPLSLIRRRQVFALSTPEPAISAEGIAVFMVVGNMMIPAAVLVTHYGAYTGTAGRTISFDDAQSQ